MQSCTVLSYIPSSVNCAVVVPPLPYLSPSTEDITNFTDPSSSILSSIQYANLAIKNVKIVFHYQHIATSSLNLQNVTG